ARLSRLRLSRLRGDMSLMSRVKQLDRKLDSTFSKKLASWLRQFNPTLAQRADTPTTSSTSISTELNSKVSQCNEEILDMPLTKITSDKSSNARNTATHVIKKIVLLSPS